jgi:hypothetical protein
VFLLSPILLLGHFLHQTAGLGLLKSSHCFNITSALAAAAAARVPARWQETRLLSVVSDDDMANLRKRPCHSFFLSSI